MMQQSRRFEEETLRVRGENLLVVSEKQLQFKRLSLQAQQLSTISTNIKDSLLAFTREQGILDREFYRALLIIVTSSLLFKFMSEDDQRSQGQRVAALKIVALFKMIHQRNVYKRKIAKA
jgi:hypothetical protein